MSSSDFVINRNNVLKKYSGSGGDVVIPDGVAKIGCYAFSGCTGLTSVTIPDSVTSIEYDAFSGCTGLTSVTIPEGVTSIGSRAFAGCIELRDVSIPDSVTHLGCNVLKDTAYSNHEDHWENDVLYCCNHLIQARNCIAGIHNIKPNTKCIGGDAFYNCKALTGVMIPDSVAGIGDGAFSNCTGLMSVKVPERVASICEGTFFNCTSLTDVIIPDRIESIGKNAFYNCMSLTNVNIPDCVKSIGKKAFSNCTGLTSVTIPNSVTSIGDSAFSNCTGLTSVTIPDSVTSIGNDAFYDCTGLTSITVGENNTTYRSAGNCLIETASKTLLLGCRNSVIPNDGSVAIIGVCAFQGCAWLTSLTIPDSVESIGAWAFSDCSGLAVDIPDGIRTIEEYAFSGVDNAVIRYGGKNHDIVKKEIFESDSCRLYLPGISLSDIPSNLKFNAVCGFAEMLGSDTPEEMQAEYAKYLKKNRKKYYAVLCDFPKLFIFFVERRMIPFDEIDDILKTIDDDESKAVILEYSKSFSEGVKEESLNKKEEKELKKALGLENMTVAECRKLFSFKDEFGDIMITAYKGNEKTVVIPAQIGKKAVKTIKGNTYFGGAFYGKQFIEKVVIPEGIERIGPGAFAECSGLTELNLPAGVKEIGNNAFRGCSGLTSMTIPSGITTIEYQTFSGCTGLTSITIPDSVRIIGGSAFRDCAGLTNVTIPDSVETIDGCAFCGCTGLMSVTIPDIVITVGYNAFADTGYYNDDSNWLNGVLYIGDYLVNVKENISGYCEIRPGTKYIAVSSFSECNGLTNITIPDSVNCIGAGAFDSCSNLTSVTIPDSVKCIEENAFASCFGLTSITIPDSVTSIERGVFFNCTGLTSVTIPNSVASIGNTAFSGCSGLTRVKIPDSVTSIGDWAFENCTGLTSMTIPDSVTAIGIGTFDGCTNLVIRCREGSYAHQRCSEFAADNPGIKVEAT